MSGLYLSENNRKLTIAAAQVDDMGDYVCEATNEAGSGMNTLLRTSCTVKPLYQSNNRLLGFNVSLRITKDVIQLISDRHKYEVHVNEIPSITDKNTKYLNRQLEESIALECAVSRGQPPPTIHWFKGSWSKFCQNIPLRVILLPLNRRRTSNRKIT